MLMKRTGLAPVFAVAVMSIAACGGGGSSSSSPSATIPTDLSVNSFDVNFSYMPKLSDLVSAGHGMVGVLLPDTTSPGRYQTFDLPYLTKALKQAGYRSSDFRIEDAGGQEQQQLLQAQGLITSGASVLIMDPVSSSIGSTIQNLAQSHGVKVISYDQPTFTGTNTYFVSFDNLQVGKLIGVGFKQCVSDWGVKSPMVFTLNGPQNSDPNSIDVAKGYNSVVWGEAVQQETPPKLNSDGYKLVGDQVATGLNNQTGDDIFQRAFNAHPEINATIEANDGLASAVIRVLRSKNTSAKKIPTTGQDATLDGMVNVLTDFQCGSVYKAIYVEAQDAVALATVLRAGVTPPPALVNTTARPPQGVLGSPQPASLLTPVWVNKSNMAKTVIKDQFIDKAALCNKAGQAACTAAGISPSS